MFRIVFFILFLKWVFDKVQFFDVFRWKMMKKKGLSFVESDLVCVFVYFCVCMKIFELFLSENGCEREKGWSHKPYDFQIWGGFGFFSWWNCLHFSQKQKNYAS